jgi:hypothetical protein
LGQVALGVRDGRPDGRGTVRRRSGQSRACCRLRWAASKWKSEASRWLRATQASAVRSRPARAPFVRRVERHHGGECFTRLGQRVLAQGAVGAGTLAVTRLRQGRLCIGQADMAGVVRANARDDFRAAA